MNKRAMPAQIWLQNGGIDPRDVSWSDRPINDGDTGYIRADLAHGRYDEPLVPGQWRWTKIMHVREKWTPRRVEEWQGMMVIVCDQAINVYASDSSPLIVPGVYCAETVAAIGPVIHSP